MYAVSQTVSLNLVRPSVPLVVLSAIVSGTYSSALALQ